MKFANGEWRAVNGEWQTLTPSVGDAGFENLLQQHNSPTAATFSPETDTDAVGVVTQREQLRSEETMDFFWDHGLFFGTCRLAIDSTRTQTAGFCSHAHADHIGRHGITLCTAETELLIRHRMTLKRAIFRTLHYREPTTWGGMQLTAFPAGHCLGSAVLLVETESGRRILYTGDFRLVPSFTAGGAELPTADVLIMESTFGDPRYQMPPRELVIEQLCDVVYHAIATGRIPIVRAYALGKAQEVTRILSDAGFMVDQSPEVAGITDIYENCGVHVGRRRIVRLGEPLDPNAVLVVAPQHDTYASLNPNAFRIAVTGWAIHPKAAAKLRVDVAIPLTDHVDYPDLFVAVEQVHPKEIYCIHGPFEFADRLKEAGWNAKNVTPES